MRCRASELLRAAVLVVISCAVCLLSVLPCSLTRVPARWSARGTLARNRVRRASRDDLAHGVIRFRLAVFGFTQLHR